MLYEAIAFLQLGQTYLGKGEVEKAIESLEYALEIEQKFVGEQYNIGLILLYLALAHEQLNKMQLARQYFLRSEETLSKAHNRYGFVLLEREYCTRALAVSDYSRFSSLLPLAEDIAEKWNYIDVQSSIELLKGDMR